MVAGHPAERVSWHFVQAATCTKCGFPRSTGGSRCEGQTTRLAIANSNVPNMVGQISTCLATERINIAELLNKSRGEYAYTLVDAEGAIGDHLLQKIRSIAGILSVRIT